jgi:acetyltransferase-like isoleucine patch superfamily enzyme
MLILVFTLLKNYGKNLRLGNMVILKNVRFSNWNTVYDYAKIVNVSIGDYTYIGPRSQITNTTIGKFCSIGPDVTIGLGKHPTNTFVSTHPSFFSTDKQAGFTFVDHTLFEEVICGNIGNDVWIGAKSIIMDGINIGNGAIIGAGAIVTKDIPSYAIVGGVPAKIIKYRFDISDINFLERIKWWENDFQWLQINHHLFSNIQLMRHYKEDYIK